MPFRIYTLCDPDTNDTKYVGKTITDIGLRLRNHIYKAKSGRSKSKVSLWILGLLQKGKRPIIEEIDFLDDSNDWQEAESMWIKRLLDNGCILLNSCAGGNGSHIRVMLDDSIIKQMGKISDQDIANKVGVSREIIVYHRNRLGIKPMPSYKRKSNPHNKGKPSPSRHIFSDDLIEKMGTVSDMEIARMAGVHAKTVCKFRKRNNIKAYYPSGEEHPGAKLKKEDVDIILAMYNNGVKKSVIAKKFNVSYTAIWDIISGRSWGK